MDEKIRLVVKPITKIELKKIAGERFGDMVKAVVDVSTEEMAIGGELHADEESLLLEKGSTQENLWGINLYPDSGGENFIEFDSMINIRPSQNNRSRDVDSGDTREQIKRIVSKLII